VRRGSKLTDSLSVDQQTSTRRWNSQYLVELSCDALQARRSLF